MRKWIFYTFVIIYTCTASVQAARANSLLYSLADLEILEKENNTSEFLQHALDIKPQLRNKHYQEMVEHMGILHIKNLFKKKIFENTE